MARPVVIGFLVLVFLMSSQFEWRQQQLVAESEASPSAAVVQQPSLSKEGVKEKIILSQEKNIRQLNELVQSLQQQLLRCHGINNTVHDTGSSSTAYVDEIERKQILED